MNEHTGQTLADGWWCLNCEFFEQDDEINTTIEQCQSCGCNGAAHVPVQVVGN